MPRPDLSRVPEYYHRYINQVKQDDLAAALSGQSVSFVEFLNAIPDAKRDYRYADEKWTIREMLLHIIDAERIFAYRALCIARKDNTNLPSFEENDYADNSKASSRNWDDMVEEFKAVRKGNEIMFAAFDRDQLESAGTVNNRSVYVLSIGFIMVGHIQHHLAVLQERYLG